MAIRLGGEGMSDKEILEEIEALWKDDATEEERRIARQFGSAGTERATFAMAILAAKRKYQQTSRPGEVKTWQTFEEWVKELDPDSPLNEYREEAWNAALASVISTWKRFEVGDSCRIRVSRDTEIEAIIGAMPIQQLHKADDFVSQPGIVRPAINTVNLTVEEKLVAVTDAMVSKDSYQERHVYRELSRVLAKGKSLDDLCREYSVPLTKEV